MKNLILFAGLAISIVACQEKKEQTKTEVVAKQVVESEKKNCKYSVKDAKVKWTSYKFTKKVGVSGGFDSVVVNDSTQSSLKLVALENTTLKIDAQSVNSNLEVRDERLRRAFFGPLMNAGEITVEVKNVTPAGMGALAVTWNGLTLPMAYKAEQKEDGFHVMTKINMEQFNAKKSMDQLNEECKDLHRGEDGKSVLWADVDIDAIVEFNEICEG